MNTQKTTGLLARLRGNFAHAGGGKVESNLHTLEGNKPPANDMRLLELANISVHYGAVIALDNASLGVEKGEIAAVMGPNGAGKSTSSERSWVWRP